MFMERGEMFYGIRSFYVYRPIVLCRFRIDPVPYTKKHKRIGSCFRHVRTYNELKSYEASDVRIRGKRSIPNLPTAWDDIYNSNMSIRSWKRTKKKKQWM